MTVHTAKKSNIILFLDGDEMSARGLSADGLDAGTARAIADEVCCEAGLSSSSEAFIEAFIFGNGVMIVIRRAAPPEKVFRFGSADDAMDAMLALCGKEPEYSTFTYYCGSYYLMISGENEMSAAALSDFGEEIPDGGMFAAYLEEHGQVIVKGDAVFRVLASVR